MAPISKPVNDVQRRFNELCVLGGGTRGGPARGRVLELLKSSGKELNKYATAEVTDHLAAFPESNPWHVCFAVGVAWGHLARFEIGFTQAVTNLLSHWNDADLKAACSFHMERGPRPIEQSLVGAHILFEKVKLPQKIPETVDQLQRAQERWLSPILNTATRPPYIGPWNATAMFMSALFSDPILAAAHKSSSPILPPGGPIFLGLQLLFRAGLLTKPPSGGELDDAGFEPGVLYENNALLAELCGQSADWSMIDVHSGVYMLGTRHMASATWV